MSVYILMAAFAISLFTLSCDDYDWGGFKSFQERGVWQDFHGIVTAVEPADLGLYRELLPAEMDMPEQPAVGVFILDYVTVVPYPMKPYLEGALAIRCEYDGEVGFYTVTMPVDSSAARDGGRSIGFPKYLAELTLGQNGESWKGVVTHEGVVRMSLEFTPGLTRELEPFEEELFAGGLPRLETTIFQKGPIEDLSVEGPDLYRITLIDKVPANWLSIQGMVKIYISPDDPWAGLIDSGALPPVGMFQLFTGGKVMHKEIYQ